MKLFERSEFFIFFTDISDLRVIEESVSQAFLFLFLPEKKKTKFLCKK